MNTNNERAFTLIELLVVISIIAILAALAFPSFRGAMETSHITKCASNLRQIGAAMNSFSIDHSNCYPESSLSSVQWNAVDATTGQQSWVQQLAPYCGSPADPQTNTAASVFTCPSSSMVSGTCKYYSYFNGAHAAYARTEASTPEPAAVRKSLIIHPSTQILSGDITNWTDSSGMLNADKNDYTQIPISLESNYHNKTINLLFADGHVENEKWSTTLSAYFDPTRMSTHYNGTTSPKGTQYQYLDPDKP